MDFIMENWPLLVAAAAIVGAAAAAVARFVGLPTEKQLAKVKEWLLWAVTEAEKDLGGGTGKLKLPAGLRPVCAAVPLAGKGGLL